MRWEQEFAGGITGSILDNFRELHNLVEVATSVEFIGALQDGSFVA
jgi:hypothetical protein